MFALILLLTVLMFIAIYKYIKFKEYFDLINRIPGPPTYPIIGNLKMLNVTVEELWNVIRSVNKQYYPITRLWFGPIPFILIQHPDDLEYILHGTKHIEKGFTYKFMQPWLETGLLTSTGSKWQHRRKILTPSFHFNILRKYSVSMNENGKALVEYLKKEQTRDIELVKLCTNYTLNVLCESAMGVVLDKMNGTNGKEYKNAVATEVDVIVFRSFRPFIPDWMFNSWTKMGRLQNSALKTLHTFTNTVLRERKEYHHSTENKYLTNFEENVDESESDYISMNTYKRKKLAMLDLMIKAEKEGLIDEHGIREELDTFIFAGHDTTGMALVFVLILLAEHKEIQEKVRAEVANIMNKNKGDINVSEIQELPYLERCIKESLRIFPPVHTVTRFLEEDACIGGYEIPKGTEVGCFIVDMHRNPKFWPEPMKYDPDRFLPENSQGRHPYSYVPFSAGPRNCIGQKFAWMEMKYILAHILHNFQLEPITKSADIKLKLALISKPTTPLYVKFVKINHDY